ncbi:Nodulation protein S (NodS) [Tistlia consotensis]|uniref:Nodulation protein S (NodS) n=1 Tax=Tistlia consotensis USBA 355 TaxID=560819 RepID=A0A1Y6BBZ5_9PROT|nr:class I SAM-dependent methyltransferase [Tistlia consotensis]SMF00116.1 Nodulation protein S (NodS) [Tistlia consotensis USBA 355]SNR76252.1 Nodulation protein S (NodS) [Tistlia consotensis]
MLDYLRNSAFISVRDVGLFLASARSDARLESLRRDGPAAAAFDRLYADAAHNDPWASGRPQYQYQRRKYDALARLLPKRRYRRALDLGCGLGLFSERLSCCADQVLGIDISEVAIGRAAERTRRAGNVELRQGDILDLGPELDGSFDLVVVADTIYYLPQPIQDTTLKALAARISELLAPDGILLVANHYFPMPNAETRLTRRIHQSFQWSPRLTLFSEHKGAFFLASLLGPVAAPA